MVLKRAVVGEFHGRVQGSRYSDIIFARNRAARTRVSERAARRADARLPPHADPAGPARSRRVGAACAAGTFPGRSLLIGVVVKVVTWTIEAAGRHAASPSLDAVDMVGSLALIFGGGYGLRAASRSGRGGGCCGACAASSSCPTSSSGSCPCLLIVTFFLLAGLLLFFNVARYLVQIAPAHAQPSRRGSWRRRRCSKLQRARRPAAVRETLERRQASVEARYPFLSLALVPVGGADVPGRARARRARAAARCP